MGQFLRQLFSAWLAVVLLVNSNLHAAAQEAAAPVNLDLTSTARTVPSSAGLVTPAESVALHQLQTTGSQSIVVGANGNATGGTFNLTSEATRQLARLLVPAGVTAVHDIAIANTIDVAGELINGGTIYALSTIASASQATFSANSIFNQRGATLSSVLPATGIAGFAPARSSVDLVLSALQSIVNEGTISSSGHLSLITGNGILNNSGTLSSTTGDINISTSTPQNLVIDNIGGSIQALEGNINVRDSSLAGKFDLTMRGGDYLSQQLNLWSGNGTIKADLGNVTGWTNLHAGEATFGASTADLKFGTIDLSGDPTFFNTNGNLSLASVPKTIGADLALIASGNVVITGGFLDTRRQVLDINGDFDLNSPTNGTPAHPSVNSGGNVTIIAGANVTSTSASSGPLSNDFTTTLTVSKSTYPGGGSATGGAVDMSATNGIATNGVWTLDGYGGNGGNVLIVAFSGSGAGGGLVPGTVSVGGSIDTWGTATTGGYGLFAKNGNVTVIAGATQDPTNGAAISLFPIYAGASPSNSDAGLTGGNVSISTATPVLSGNVMIKNGSIQSGSGTITPAPQPQPTSISVEAYGGEGGVFLNDKTRSQRIANDYFLQALNDRRIDAGLAPAEYREALATLATLLAETQTATGKNAHFTITGASSTDMAAYMGLNFAFYADNWGGGIVGRTLRHDIDGHIEGMLEEPDEPGTHATHLLHDPYVGFSMSNHGFFADMNMVFSDADPGGPPDPLANLEVRGGLAGVAGLLPTEVQWYAGPAVAGDQILPTSIVAGYNRNSVTLTAGNKVTVDGSILANGRARQYDTSFLGFLNGLNGGTVTVTAGGDVSLFNVQAGGGAGGGKDNVVFLDQQELFPVTVAGKGGDGGLVSITSRNGNITMTPGYPCAPCIAIAAQGGSGGWAAGRQQAGGAGGKGGTVNLSAPNGNILISAIEAGGGGGSGGAAGTSGGKGGAGGAGGIISMNSRTITVQHYLSASGGGGGGAGGADSQNNGGGGGGGGAFGMAGLGGFSGAGFACCPVGFTDGFGGGGGGGGGHVPGFGGGAAGTATWHLPDGNGATVDGGGGVGGPAGGFAQGGKGGAPFDNGDGGGDGGDAGKPGKSSTSGRVAGGAAGSGGAISLTAPALVVQGTVGGFWTPYFPFGGSTLSILSSGSSLLALGPGGKVTLNTVPVLTAYSANADYSSTVRSETLLWPSAFSVTAASGTNRSAGAIQAAAINIYGTARTTVVTNGTFNPASTIKTSITINADGNQLAYQNGSLVTPAELVAIVQMATTKLQPLLLNAQGAATGGTMTVAPANVPANGFTTLVLPAGITATGTVTNLLYSSSATVNGLLKLTGANPTLTTPSLTVNGTVSGTTGTLNIQATGNKLTLAMGAQGTISTTAGSISFNGTAPAEIAMTSSLQGTLTAGGTGNKFLFNGGFSTGALPVTLSVNSANAAFQGSGATVSLGVAANNLTTGNISANSLTLSAAGAANIGQMPNTLISGGALTINSGTGNVNLGSEGTTSGALLVQSLSMTTGTGSVTVVNRSPLLLGPVTSTGTVNLSAADSITSNGIMSFASATIRTLSFINNHSITSSGTLAIQNSRNLLLSGTGTFSVTGQLNLISDYGNVFIASNQNITGGLTITATRGLTVVKPAVTIQATGNVNVTTVALLNEGGFNSPVVLNLGSTEMNFAAIANPTGDIKLTKNMLINTAGKNLAILARGNVIADGITSINLTSTTGQSGSLSILAGVAFVEGSTEDPDGLPGTTLFSVNGPSAIGGSVNLSGVSLQTSSAQSTPDKATGGTVLIVATAGTDNAGVIYTGGINTSSTSGKAGAVILFGEGGISVGAPGINASGKLRGGDVLLRGVEITATGPLVFLNGYLSPQVPISSLPLVNGSGSAISVSGPVNSSSTAGSGGNVTFSAESALQVTGSIATRGLVSSGDVSMFSLNGALTITGDINTSGLPITLSTSPLPASNGGNILVGAPSFLTVTGKIVSSGGSTVGTGDAGSAGQISMLTSTDSNQFNLFGGNITVGSYLEANGGNARSTAGGGRGGKANLIEIFAGTIQVKGSNASASISSTGGKAFNPLNNGSHGVINLATFAVQPLPVNFNMTSPSSNTALLEYALPGGLFNVGNALVNGTAGNIVSGNYILSSKNAANVTNGLIQQGKISLSVFGGTSNIKLENGNNLTIAPAFFSNGVATRVRISPAYAVALYQTSRGFIQSIALTALGTAASSGQGITDSLINVPQYDLPTFKTFVLATSDPTNNIRLDVLGLSPYVNLSAAINPTISGQLSFSIPNSFAVVNLGAQVLNILTGGELLAGDRIAFLGSAAAKIVVGGKLGSQQMMLLTPAAGTFTLQGSASSIIGTYDLVVDPALLVRTTSSSTLNVNTTGGFGLPVVLQNTPLPTLFGQFALSAIPAAPATVKLNLLTGSTPVGLGGTASVGALQVTATNLTVLNSSSLTTTKGDLKLIANGGNILLGSSSTFSATGGNVVIMATGTVSGGTGNIFAAHATGTTTSPIGGGIELASGTLVSRIALAKPPVTLVDSSALGGNVTIQTNGTTGFIELTTSGGGTVDLTSSGTQTASIDIDLNRGKVVFQAVGAGKSVQLDGATFEVDTFTPIAFYQSGAPGEAFLKIDQAGTIESSFGSVQVTKGAMLYLEKRSSRLRVIALSGPGHVVIHTGNRTISLNPGEELTVQRTSPEQQAETPISRRHTTTYEVGNGLTARISEVSIVSLLTNAQCMEKVCHPTSAATKALNNKILKTAAAIHHVTSSKGAYRQ